MCARQFQNKIDESVYALLKIQIDRFGLQDIFEVQKSKIICTKTGSEFMFYGIWRNIREIKSQESIDILWIEEGDFLTQEQFEILEPTIRKSDSEIWIIFNPNLPSDYAYSRFVLGDEPGLLKRKINYDENPFLSATALNMIESAKETEDFEHVYLGFPRANDSLSVIKRAHVLAAIDAHKKLGIEPLGRDRVGFDVGDTGDECALAPAHGSLLCGIEEWRNPPDQLMSASARAWRYARERRAHIIYDAVGMGAHVGSKLAELNIGDHMPVSYDKFFAGGAVELPNAHYKDTGIKNKDYFANIKAQKWFSISDRFANTYNAVNGNGIYDQSELIFIDSGIPHLEKLINELTAPRVIYDGAARAGVESKKDLAKRGIPSHNLADAVIMAFI